MSGGVPAGEAYDPGTPAYEAARLTIAGELRRLAVGEPKSGYREMADRLMRGEQYEIPSWLAIVLLARATPTPPSRDADVERDDMAWFSDQRRLSLDFYSPMYGDDDDQSEEWRVTKESGPINDREWDVIGRGDTVFAAVASARAALQALGERP